MNPRQLERVETEYEIYKIVAADLRGRSEAFAFAGRRKIDELAASSVAGAVDDMRTRLDERLATFMEKRVNGIPSTEEFTDALNVAFANGQARLEQSLSVHCRFRNATATFAETASRSDLVEEQVERDYLRFGRWLSAQLQAAAKEAPNAPEKRRPMAVFASFHADGGAVASCFASGTGCGAERTPVGMTQIEIPANGPEMNNTLNGNG